MTPILLFHYFCAIAGGVFLIGLAVFVLLVFAALVTGWAKHAPKLGE